MSVAKQNLGELLEIWKTTRGSSEPIQAYLASWLGRGWVQGPRPGSPDTGCRQVCVSSGVGDSQPPNGWLPLEDGVTACLDVEATILPMVRI